jgi:hypothetical protein
MASNWPRLKSLAPHNSKEASQYYAIAQFNVALWQCCGSRSKVAFRGSEKGIPYFVLIARRDTLQNIPNQASVNAARRSLPPFREIKSHDIRP